MNIIDRLKAWLFPKTMELDSNTVYITCDGSVTKNPGGRGAIGSVIRIPRREPIHLQRFVPTANCTNNQAEYDAIYMSLDTLFGLSKLPFENLVITSDSQLVVNQLNQTWKCTDSTLKKKRDSILDSLSTYPGKVTIQWRRRNSTEDLRTANKLAQSLNSVKIH